MKRKNLITVVFATGIMLLATLGAMWLALTLFGRLSDAPIKDEQKFSFNNNLLGVNISQQDYDKYPAHSSSEIPDYMKNYILKPQDAAVLAAKQIEEITGLSVEGKAVGLMLNTNEKCWKASYLDDNKDNLENVNNNGEYYADAVSGEIYTFFDGTNFYEFEFTADDYNECALMAISAASKQFPNKIESIKLQDNFIEEIDNTRFPIVFVQVDADRTAQYFFAKNDKDQFYIRAFVTR